MGILGYNAEEKVYVTGMKGPFEEGWQRKVDEFAGMWAGDPVDGERGVAAAREPARDRPDVIGEAAVLVDHEHAAAADGEVDPLQDVAARQPDVHVAHPEQRRPPAHSSSPR